jgi:hypothetical protein
MAQARRMKISADQRTDMWRRWKAGESLHEIGHAFSKDHASIQFMLAQRGGIAPATRRRPVLALTLPEREEILPMSLACRKRGVRWCCIDRLSWHRLSGTGIRSEMIYQKASPIPMPKV